MATAVLVLLTLHWGCTPSAGGTLSENLREGLPHFDPAIRERAVTADDAPAPEAPVAAPPPPVSPAPTSSLVLLPRLVVRPPPRTEKLDTVVSLPRVVVRPREDKANPDAFETPAGRDARLVKKHLSLFDRSVLNRFTLPFGLSKEQRARQAEAIEHSAAELDPVAFVLELSQSEGGDREEEKKLKEAYLDAYVSRPK